MEDNGGGDAFSWGHDPSPSGDFDEDFDPFLIGDGVAGARISAPFPDQIGYNSYFSIENGFDGPLGNANLPSYAPGTIEGPTLSSGPANNYASPYHHATEPSSTPFSEHYQSDMGPVFGHDGYHIKNSSLTDSNNFCGYTPPTFSHVNLSSVEDLSATDDANFDYDDANERREEGEDSNDGSHSCDETVHPRVGDAKMVTYASKPKKSKGEVGNESNEVARQPSFDARLHKADYATFYYGPNFNEEKPTGSKQSIADLEASLSHISKMINNIGKGGDFEQNLHQVQDRIQQEKCAEARKHSGRADATFPTDPIEVEKLVIRLYKAINNTLMIADKKTKHGLHAQAVNRISNGYYIPGGNNDEMKLLCWQVLAMCRKVQLGTKCTPHYYTTKIAQFASFIERWDAIVNGCTTSKALCKQLLDPQYIGRIVESPETETKQKYNNAKINSERDVQNEIGRKAIRKGLSRDIIDDFPDANASVNSESKPNVAAQTRALVQEPQETPTAAKFLEYNAVLTPQNTHRASSAAQSSTGKRKLALLTLSNEEDAEAPITPTKKPTRAPKVGQGSSGLKPRSSTRRNDGRAQLSGSQLKMTHSASMGTLHDGDVFTSRNGENMTEVSSFRTTRSSTQAATSIDRGRMEEEYKKIICGILGVDYNKHAYLSLYQLRSYARQYNVGLKALPWVYINNNSYRLTGLQCTIGNDGYVFEHFALAIPEFRDLAFDRRDLLPGGLMNPDQNLQQFSTGGNIEKDEALGVVQNDIGLHP